MKIIIPPGKTLPQATPCDPGTLRIIQGIRRLETERALERDRRARQRAARPGTAERLRRFLTQAPAWN
jgi:hypothetical protein